MHASLRMSGFASEDFRAGIRNLTRAKLCSKRFSQRTQRLLGFGVVRSAVDYCRRLGGDLFSYLAGVLTQLIGFLGWSNADKFFIEQQIINDFQSSR